MPDGRSALRVALSLALIAGSAGAASGQALSRVSLDSVSAVDLFEGQGTTGHPGASLDISAVVRLSDRWSARVRPWFFKSSANDSTWSREIYQAALRYQRAGTVAVRLDAGYVESPIGLGILDMRADINPTIQPHLSYLVPMLPFERGGPGVRAISSTYPLGAVFTASGTRWDLRTAVLSTAPTRRYALNAATGNAKTTPTAILGGGITPIVGLRVGASMADGRYAATSELTSAAGQRRGLRMWTGEVEYAFGYTRLSGEVTRERFIHGNSTATAGSWFVQAAHTMSARWFVAGRVEGIDAPPPVFAPNGPRVSFRTSEATAGYRLSPEWTARGSFVSQRFFTASTYDRRVGIQMVWSRRWW